MLATGAARSSRGSVRAAQGRLRWDARTGNVTCAPQARRCRLPAPRDTSEDSRAHQPTRGLFALRRVAQQCWSGLLATLHPQLQSSAGLKALLYIADPCSRGQRARLYTQVQYRGWLKAILHPRVQSRGWLKALRHPCVHSNGRLKAPLSLRLALAASGDVCTRTQLASAPCHCGPICSNHGHPIP